MEAQLACCRLERSVSCPLGGALLCAARVAIATHVEPRRQVTVTRTWGLSRAAPLRGLGREAPQRRQPKNGPARRHRSPGRHGLAARDLRAPGCRCRRRARSADCTSPAAASARRQFCPTASLLLPYPPPALSPPPRAPRAPGLKRGYMYVRSVESDPVSRFFGTSTPPAFSRLAVADVSPKRAAPWCHALRIVRRTRLRGCPSPPLPTRLVFLHAVLLLLQVSQDLEGMRALAVRPRRDQPFAPPAVSPARNHGLPPPSHAC